MKSFAPLMLRFFVEIEESIKAEEPMPWATRDISALLVELHWSLIRLRALVLVDRARAREHCVQLAVRALFVFYHSLDESERAACEVKVVGAEREVLELREKLEDAKWVISALAAERDGLAQCVEKFREESTRVASRKG